MKPRVIHPPAGGETWFEEGCFITEICNSSDDPALSIARARVTARTETEWHSLDVDERYLIAEGGGIMEMDGAPPTRVNPGDVVVVPAGCRQRIRNDTDDDLVFYCLCTPRFTPDAYRREPDRSLR